MTVAGHDRYERIWLLFKRLIRTDLNELSLQWKLSWLALQSQDVKSKVFIHRCCVCDGGRTAQKRVYCTFCVDCWTCCRTTPGTVTLMLEWWPIPECWLSCLHTARKITSTMWTKVWDGTGVRWGCLVGFLWGKLSAASSVNKTFNL